MATGNATFTFKSAAPKKKQVSGSEAFGFLLGAFLLGVVVFAVSSWVLMITIGIVHAEAFSSLPAISYVGTMWTSILINLVGAIFNSRLSIKNS
jgi:hypothetical protein